MWSRRQGETLVLNEAVQLDLNEVPDRSSACSRLRLQRPNPGDHGGPGRHGAFLGDTLPDDLYEDWADQGRAKKRVR